MSTIPTTNRIFEYQNEYYHPEEMGPRATKPVIVQGRTIVTESASSAMLHRYCRQLDLPSLQDVALSVAAELRRRGQTSEADRLAATHHDLTFALHGVD